MKSSVSKLVLAAVLASSVPAAASARDCDHDRGRDHHPPAAYPAPWTPRPGPGHHWREVSWRERELARIRHELRELDERRSEVYARHGWNARKVRKFERWYAARRAELERRWSELQLVAYRY